MSRKYWQQNAGVSTDGRAGEKETIVIFFRRFYLSDELQERLIEHTAHFSYLLRSIEFFLNKAKNCHPQRSRV
jgi:hypothetical protein